MALITRRLFTSGFLAAPAIVHDGNLMPVKAIKPTLWRWKGLSEELVTKWDDPAMWETVSSSILYPCWRLYDPHLPYGSSLAWH